MFPRLRSGDIVTPELWNSLVSAMERLLSPAGSGDIQGDVSASGFTIRDYGDHPLWARLTDDRDGNCYGWQPILAAPDGKIVDISDFDGVEGGASDYLPAVAITGATDLPENTKVQLWPSPTGEPFYVFEGGAGASGQTLVHLTAESISSGTRYYTAKTVRRNLSNTGWEEDPSPTTYTNVVEDQNRRLIIDSGSTVSQAYVLNRDSNGKLWVELDQYAEVKYSASETPNVSMRPGFVNIGMQRFQGPKLFHAAPYSITPDSLKRMAMAIVPEPDVFTDANPFPAASIRFYSNSNADGNASEINVIAGGQPDADGVYQSRLYCTGTTGATYAATLGSLTLSGKNYAYSGGQVNPNGSAIEASMSVVASIASTTSAGPLGMYSYAVSKEASCYTTMGGSRVNIRNDYSHPAVTQALVFSSGSGLGLSSYYGSDPIYNGMSMYAAPSGVRVMLENANFCLGGTTDLGKGQVWAVRSPTAAYEVVRVDASPVVLTGVDVGVYDGYFKIPAYSGTGSYIPIRIAGGIVVHWGAVTTPGIG